MHSLTLRVPGYILVSHTMTPFKSQILARLERYFETPPEVIPASDDIEFAILHGGENRPYNAVFTLGLSSVAMEGGPDEDWRFAELVLLLPLDWPLDLTPENWPLVWLQRLALFPRRQNSWLGLAHTIPNGNPAQPFAETTDFAAWMLIPPIELGEKFPRFRLESGEVLNFWTPIPIFADELALKTNKGATELINKFARAGISDIFDPNRISIYKRKTNIFGKYKD